MKKGKRFRRARRVRWWLVFLDRGDVQLFLVVVIVLMAFYVFGRMAAAGEALRREYWREALQWRVDEAAEAAVEGGELGTEVGYEGNH